jgi:hypothetical protein
MKKRKSIVITLSKRWLYIFIILLILVIGGIVVYAYKTNNPQVFEHNIGEIASPSPCAANQFLQWNGTAWKCAS